MNRLKHQEEWGVGVCVWPAAGLLFSQQGKQQKQQAVLSFGEQLPRAHYALTHASGRGALPLPCKLRSRSHLEFDSN